MTESDDDVGAALPPETRTQWFEIEYPLGKGGFGITYRARDTNLDRVVALKEYFPRSAARRKPDGGVGPVRAEDEVRYRAGLARFVAEARTLARLEHPNVVRVYTVFEERGTAYIVMEHVAGTSLHESIRRDELSSERLLLRVVHQILDGLEHVHGRGFIHGDLHPSNVLLRPNGRVVIVDFGAARAAFSMESGDGPPAVLFPGYSAPECYGNDVGALGPWTDLYAVAATVYACIDRGVAPRSARTREQACSIGAPDPLDPALYRGRGRYSAALLRSVDAALELDPRSRPHDVVERRKAFPPATVGPTVSQHRIDSRVLAKLLCDDRDRVERVAGDVPRVDREAYIEVVVEVLEAGAVERKLGAMTALLVLRAPDLVQRLVRLAGESRFSVRRRAGTLPWRASGRGGAVDSELPHGGPAPQHSPGGTRGLP